MTSAQTGGCVALYAPVLTMPQPSDSATLRSSDEDAFTVGA